MRPPGGPKRAPGFAGPAERFHPPGTRRVLSSAEDSPSGLWRSLGKRVGLIALRGSNPLSSATHAISGAAHLRRRSWLRGGLGQQHCAAQGVRIPYPPPRTRSRRRTHCGAVRGSGAGWVNSTALLRGFESPILRQSSIRRRTSRAAPSWLPGGVRCPPVPGASPDHRRPRSSRYWSRSCGTASPRSGSRRGGPEGPA